MHEGQCGIPVRPEFGRPEHERRERIEEIEAMLRSLDPFEGYEWPGATDPELVTTAGE